MLERDLSLVRACQLLAECEFLLRNFDGEEETSELLADVRRHCDEAEAAPGDAESAATIAVLRAVAATFALRRVVLFTVDSDFDDDDGVFLNGLAEHDEDGETRQLTEEAIEATRAALDADPEDPLVPLYLGHALTWSGDEEGATAAYQEADRRDLEVGTSARSHGFALVIGVARISNNDWANDTRLFRSVADARAYVDKGLDLYVTLDVLEEAGGELTLSINRPGHPVAEYDLNARINDDEELSIDWSDIPMDTPLEPPLPPGRPLRIAEQNCFCGDV
jgi:tetratricopeptide (TPR) repeat protein